MRLIFGGVVPHRIVSNDERRVPSVRRRSNPNSVLRHPFNPLVKPDTSERRKRLFDPNGYPECDESSVGPLSLSFGSAHSSPTCAIVGSGSPVRDLNNGYEIEQHDVVVRFGLPKLVDQASGAKTTVLFLNPSVLITPDAAANQRALEYALSLQPKVISVNCRRINSALESVYELVQRTGVSAQNATVVTRCEYLQKAHESLLSTVEFRPEKGTRPTAMLYMLPYFLETCRQVHVYGFWPFPKDCQGKPVPYHYWENEEENAVGFTSQHQTELDLVLLRRLEQKYEHLHIRTAPNYACGEFTAEHVENSVRVFHLPDKTKDA